MLTARASPIWRRLLEALWAYAEAQPRLHALWRGSATALIIAVISAGLRWSLQVLIARWLGASAFGDYSYALVMAQILTVVAGFGIGASVVKFIPGYMARGDWGLIRGLVMRSRQLTAASSLLLAVVTIAAVRIVEPQRFEVGSLMMGAVLIPFVALSGLEQELGRARERILMTYALPLILQPVLEMAALGGLWILSGRLDPVRAIGIRIATVALVLAPQMASLRSALPRAVRRAKPIYDNRGWMSVGLLMLVTYIGVTLSSRADLLVLGWFRPADDVGVYSAAVMISGLVGLLVAAAGTRAGPMFSNLFARGQRRELELCAQGASRLTFWLSLPLIVALAALGKPLLAVFGHDFGRGYSALLILLVGQLSNAAMGPIGVLLLMTGFERTTAMVVAGSATLDLVAALVLVPRLGMVGAAVASMLAATGWNVAIAVSAKSALGIDPVALWRRESSSDETS
ncbi:MAG TPA: oligosaccharide flippase family protein [Candidatus Binataceae bacterium]|nr:oligosaccharide flippase family protein [Candidatus Binataceae bacterium]